MISPFSGPNSEIIPWNNQRFLLSFPTGPGTDRASLRQEQITNHTTIKRRCCHGLQRWRQLRYGTTTTMVPTTRDRNLKNAWTVRCYVILAQQQSTDDATQRCDNKQPMTIWQQQQAIDAAASRCLKKVYTEFPYSNGLEDSPYVDFPHPLSPLVTDVGIFHSSALSPRYNPDTLNPCSILTADDSSGLVNRVQQSRIDNAITSVLSLESSHGIWNLERPLTTATNSK